MNESDAKILLDKIKTSEKYRKNIIDDKTISFKEKALLLRESILSFNSGLNKEELETMESDEFYELYCRYKTNTEPKNKYQEYLLSSEWKYIKRKVIIRANYCCEGCGYDGILEVHHKTYDRVGEELLTDLIALCTTCHKKIHGKHIKSDWHNYLKGLNDAT